MTLFSHFTINTENGAAIYSLIELLVEKLQKDQNPIERHILCLDKAFAQRFGHLGISLDTSIYVNWEETNVSPKLTA